MREWGGACIYPVMDRGDIKGTHFSEFLYNINNSKREQTLGIKNKPGTVNAAKSSLRDSSFYLLSR